VVNRDYFHKHHSITSSTLERLAMVLCYTNWILKHYLDVGFEALRAAVMKGCDNTVTWRLKAAVCPVPVATRNTPLLDGRDSKIWSRVPRDSDPRMTALARASSYCKRQTRPLVRESAPRKQTHNCPDGCFIPRETGQLTVGRNITLTLDSVIHTLRDSVITELLNYGAQVKTRG
jgi:hypothetical protein